MRFKYNIRLSGSSSHGLVQASRILAEAAAIYDNKYASESSSYGPEARGNAGRAEIIISDEAIDYPKVKVVDFLVVLTQEAFDKYIDDLAPKGLVVADTGIVPGDRPVGRKLFQVPFFDILEREEIKYSMINIFVIGVFNSLSRVISERSIEKAIVARAPKMSERIFLKVYKAGLKTGKEYPGNFKDL